MDTLTRIRDAIRRTSPRRSLLDLVEFYSGLGDSAWLIYGLVRSLKPDICVEIGSGRGKSACFAGRALKDNRHGHLYAIDPHSRTDWNDQMSVHTNTIIQRNLRWVGVRDYVTIIRQTSDVAARQWHDPIDILFIDGDHSYEGVKRDWDLFQHYVRPSGIVIFHDTMWNLLPPSDYPAYYPEMGVPQFVEELRVAGYPVVTVLRDYGISLVQPIKGGLTLDSRGIPADTTRMHASPRNGMGGGM